MEHLSLRSDGEPTREQWERAAADVLRKSGRMTAEDPDSLVRQRLARTTLDGVQVTPLGTQESVEGLPPLGLPGQAPYTRGSTVSHPEDGWDVRAWLADPDPARSAADAVLDLENGVTSLWLGLGDGAIAVPDLGTVLERVHLDAAPVVLDAPGDPVDAAEAFASVLESRGLTPAPGTSLGGDPVGAAVRRHREPTRDAPVGPADEADEVVTRLAELAGRLGTRALTVDATAVHDAGGTDAQELGYSLAVGVDYLRVLTGRAGLDVGTAAGLLEFRYAVTDDQLVSIAKLRAARRLWHRALELSGVPDAPGQVQHAVTSRPMTTKYDPWVNMLRGTVAAFAAGVGGAASVTVLPFDSALGLPDALSRRNARNTSSLLIHEAHLAKVSDPAGGAYAVERLTDDLAQAGWAQLQRIEAEGGVRSSVANEGGLLGRVREEGRRPRESAVAHRRRPVTGVSEFPNLHEVLPERRPFPAGAPGRDALRYAARFEELRDAPSAAPVFLATMGTVAQHTARATFAANLLAVGGVDVVPAGATSGPDDVVEAYRQAGSGRVVCLAGPDTAYAEWGPGLVAALRDAGAAYIVLAGRPGELPVDDSCAVGVDALAFLHRIREELAR